MLGLLSSAMTGRASELAGKFRSAQPFRHVVMDNFLASDFCEALRREFPAFHGANAANERGEIGGKAVVSNVRAIGPAYARFDKLIQCNEFLSFIGEIAGIPRLLYDPEYFGGGTHENINGQSLDIHIDFNYHPRTQTHRRLNLIVFLNPEWQQEWGGCLELHRDPWGSVAEDFTISVLPLLNRCVLFETTESSWHGFRQITIPESRSGTTRRSLAVYFYTKDRPAEETAPGHSTVYVPERLPEYFQAGHTLTEDDLYTLQVLLKRRDDQIRFLYEREKEIEQATYTMRAVWTSPPFQLARSMLRPWKILRTGRTYKR